MPKILAVFGATGQQGSSVLKYVLNDPDLSKQYTIRAITRDVDSDKAKELKKSVDVVQGDVLIPSSIETALTGVHTVFAMTTPSFTADGFEVEYNSAKTIADAAVAKGVQYIIFSTLPAVRHISGCKYTNAIFFDAKAQAEQYIRGLSIQSAFVSLGSYMENFSAMPLFVPRRQADGTYLMSRLNSPTAKLPLVDAVGDTGKFVGAILAEPAKYEGKTFCAATALYSMQEVAASMSKASGKTVAYKQVSREEWKSSLPFAQDILADVFSYGEEFEYYGPGTEKLVRWAAEHARGRVSTFDEYLQAHPLQLA